MKKFIIVLILFLSGCYYTTYPTQIVNDRCVYIEGYDKYLCIDNLIDSTQTYFFIDKNRYENPKSKFMGLSSHQMVVVDNKDLIILSNESNSLKVKWFNDISPCVGDTLIVICKEIMLSNSVLVISN